MKGEFNGKGILYEPYTLYYKSGKEKSKKFQPKVYEGDFKNGQENGKGILYYEPRFHRKRQKKKYIDSFKNGKFDGKGKSFTRNGEIIYEGLWEDGESVLNSSAYKIPFPSNFPLSK